MLTKEEENNICKSCGKCCMGYWIYTYVPEEVERFNTLSETYVKVEHVKKGLWKVWFKLPCKHLKCNQDNTVECMIYDKKRPKYCPEYPKNFLSKDIDKEVLEHEKSFCPLLKKISEVSADSSNDKRKGIFSRFL